MSKHFSLVLLFVLLCASGRAETDSGIKTPQAAVVIFTSGRTLRGTLVSINEKEIRFKLDRAGTVAAVYKVEQIKAIRTADDAFVFDTETKTWQGVKSRVAREPAEPPVPPAKEKEPAEKVPEAKEPVTGTEIVVAEGVGTDAEEALKDALRAAVRQVVGSLVDAETLVKNDKVISDKVLTYSAGIVTKYDEISKTENKGLFRVRIKATVERRSVIARLKEAKISVTRVDGKGLFAEALTDIEAAKDARALVEKLFQDYPFGCLEAEVVGKPRIVSKDDAKATIQVDVRFSADPKAYKSLSEKLHATLTKIARDRGEFSLAMEPDRTTGLYTGRQNVDSFWPTAMPKVFVHDKPKKGCVAVALTTQVSKLQDRSEWSYFILDESVKGVLRKYARAVGEAKLSLLDKDNEVVATDRFSSMFAAAPPYTVGNCSITLVTPIGNAHSGVLYMVGPEKELDSDPRVFLVSPLFFTQRTNRAAYKGSFVVSRQVTLTLEELKSIHSIKCELGFGIGKAEKE
jgi:hypothetical protein